MHLRDRWLSELGLLPFIATFQAIMAEASMKRKLINRCLLYLVSMKFVGIP